jgi:hypothetical protein
MRVGHPTLGNFVGIVEIFAGNTRYLPHTIGDSHKLKITSKFRWKFKKYQNLNQRIVKLISRLHIYFFQELEIAKSDRMTAAAEALSVCELRPPKLFGFEICFYFLDGSFQK